jgi:hypothetical protein
MNTYLYIAVLMLFTFNLNAQKVDLDKYNFQFRFRQLPKNPLPANYRTYTLEIVAPGSIREVFPEEYFDANAKLEGWRRVLNGPSHLMIKYELEDLIFKEVTISEREEVKKDKDGKETGRTTYYKVSAPYSWQGIISVKDLNDSTVFWDKITATSVWTSRETSTYKEAASYWNNNRADIKNQVLKDVVKENLSATNIHLNASFGFAAVSRNQFLWILDSKKHPEFDAQQTVIEQLKIQVEKVTADGFPMEAKSSIEEIIKYFDNIPARFATDDKGHKKLRYGSFYNKAKIYLLLDNPQAAMAEADKLIANDYDKNDGESLKEDAKRLLEDFAKNNLTSRHYRIDESALLPPALAESTK